MEYTSAGERETHTMIKTPNYQVCKDCLGISGGAGKWECPLEGVGLQSGMSM